MLCKAVGAVYPVKRVKFSQGLAVAESNQTA